MYYFHCDSVQHGGKEKMISLPAIKKRVNDIEDESIRADMQHLIDSIDLLEEKMIGHKCNTGHENVLPLYLWDCPTCTAILREELATIKTDQISLFDLLGYCLQMAERNRPIGVDHCSRDSKLEKARKTFDSFVRGNNNAPMP